MFNSFILHSEIHLIFKLFIDFTKNKTLLQSQCYMIGRQLGKMNQRTIYAHNKLKNIQVTIIRLILVGCNKSIKQRVNHFEVRNEQNENYKKSNIREVF